MKTSNLQQGRAHPEAIIRGWVSHRRAGSTGITIGDGTTSGTSITGITVDGGTVIDNGDGTVTIILDTPDNWFDVTTYGAIGDGAIDDTDAIQAAIDACYAAGGGTVYFPPGVYLVGGALQDTGAFNGQILLPDVSHSALQITLTFKGALRPPFHPNYTLDTDDFPGGYSVIKSTLTGASGTASCFSAGNDTTYAYLGGGNNLSVVVEDLICLSPDNPTFTFWNLQTMTGGAIPSLQISTPGAFAGSPTQPTHSNQFGIKLPMVYMSNGTPVGTLSVGGQYHQVLGGELTDYDNLIVGPGIHGLVVPDMVYTSTVRRLQATGCQSVITAIGSDPRFLDVLSFVRESWTTGPAWAETVADLDDATDLIYGYHRWQCTVTGGAADTFIKNGGANVLDEEMGPQWGGGTAAASGHYEVLMTGASPAEPLEDGSGTDWLYVLVS